MRYLTARIDRLAAGRFGLNAGEIQDALRVWVDGRQVGIVLEGPIRTPLVIRGSEISRRSSVDFARVPMVSQDGKVVELSQLAEVRTENGPIQVIREEGQRFATVLANVVGPRSRRLRRRGQGGGRAAKCRRRKGYTLSNGAASSKTSSAPRRGSRSSCRSRWR